MQARQLTGMAAKRALKPWCSFTQVPLKCIMTLPDGHDSVENQETDMIMCSPSLPLSLCTAGLLLWLSGLFVLLQLLPQDQTVHGDPIHVRPLLPVGHRRLCHHDVPHCGAGDERQCKYIST